MSDIHALAEFGRRGVLCLLSDSTRAERPGYTPSERIVGEAFREIMQGLTGRVIVATFASNIARIQQVFDAADTFGRKVAVIVNDMREINIDAQLGRDGGAAQAPQAPQACGLARLAVVGAGPLGARSPRDRVSIRGLHTDARRARAGERGLHAARRPAACCK